MPLVMEVGLVPGDCVRWDPAPLPKKGGSPSSPIFGPYLLWPNGWMDEDGIWHGGGPGHIVPDGDPASPPPKREAEPPIFDPFLLCPNGSMHQNASWCGGRPQLRRLC